jgi:hypothetical protein
VHDLLEKPMVLSQVDSIEGVVEEPTILLLSTGPHWLEREVTSEKGVSDGDLLIGYGNMVGVIF